MNRKWSCYRSPSHYTIMLQYGDLTFTTQFSKNEVFHTIKVQEYIKYKLYRLNNELKEAIFPLTR